MVKLYVPIENLEVESKILLGKFIIHPSKDARNVIERFNKVTYKTKNTDKQKKDLAEWYENELKQNLGNYAFVELEVESEGDQLIPEDLSLVYESIKEVLAVLYLLQKQIAGSSTIEHQKFGLTKDLYRSLNYVVALQGDDKSSYSSQREGVLGDWTFVDREINKFSTNKIYIYFDKLLRKQNRNDIEKRIFSAIVWLYDAAMDFSHVNRFIMLFIAQEVLFASGRTQKSFRLARFSTLLSHLYILDSLECLCPILESHSAREYDENLKRLNLPGLCSVYWDLRKWYKIRSEIIHDAARFVSSEDSSSFEWWTYQLITTAIRTVSESKITTLDELEFFLEKTYAKKKKSFPMKSFTIKE